ncbi:unnamed protein product [Effrenium voratum]|nr:unnamed protein product [Effrenium voratum]
MAGMKVEVKASSRDYPMPRYTPLAWFGACEAGMDVPCSISAPHHFRAGEQTLLRVRHRDNVAGDWLRVGLRIHNALAHDGSTVPAELVRSEVHRGGPAAHVDRLSGEREASAQLLPDPDRLLPDPRAALRPELPARGDLRFSSVW